MRRRQPARAKLASPEPARFLDAWQARFNQRPRLRVLAAFALIWLALIAWRWEILASPPYWDSAMGLFVEADFLARTHFDYHRLLADESRFIEGGSAIYIASILPTLLAVGMACCTSTTLVLVAAHLATLAMATLATLLLFGLLRPAAGRWGAALVCLAVLTTPLFAAQIDMIGMDLPLAVWGLIVLTLLHRQRYVLAAAASLAAFFTKLSGGLLTGALVVCLGTLVALSLGSHDLHTARRRWLGLGAALLSLGCELVVADWLSLLPKSGVEQYQVDRQSGLASLSEVRDWCPDLLLIFTLTLAASLIAGMGLWARAFGQNSARPAWRRAVSAARQLFTDHLPTFFGWFAILGLLTVLSFVYTIPRYLTIVLPFLWLNAATLLFALPRVRPWGLAVLVLVVGFNLVNARGRFFPPMTIQDPFDRQTGALLERSREYLDDHRANLAAMRVLARVAGGRPIVAPSPFVHFLSLPRLGYVDAPLRGYAANTFSSPTFPAVARLREDRPSDPIFIWAENRFVPVALCRLPKPEAEDEILYQDPRLSPLAVFSKARPGGLGPEGVKARYVVLLWPGSDLVVRAEQLIAAKDFPAAIGALREALARDPRPETRYKLAALLAAQGELDEALTHFEAVLAQVPHNGETHQAVADVYLAKHDAQAAIHHLREAAKLQPSDAEAHRRLGILLAREQQYEPARVELARAVELNPHDAVACYWLGIVLRQLARPSEALAAWEQVLRIQPDDAATHVELGRFYYAQGNAKAALEHLRPALAARPDSVEAANLMAWMLATSDDTQQRNGAEAVRLAEQACRQTENRRPELLDTLAAAYAEAGRFDEALATAQKALQLARSAGNAELAAAIEERYRLYRAGGAYHETRKAKPAAGS